MNQQKYSDGFSAVSRALVFTVLALGFSAPLQAGISGLAAAHRDGQTFITWTEDNSVDGYHVYRHDQVITAATLADATRLTDKWGPLDQETSKNPHVIPDSVPGEHGYYVISDLGIPLSDSTGLFVYTIEPDDSNNAYYAITTVISGTETLAISNQNSLQAPIIESNSKTKSVLTHVLTNSTYPEAKTYLFTQYMDYANWNPTFEGYAYLYAVSLPANYDPANQWALSVRLHAHTERFRYEPGTEFPADYNVIELYPTDPTIEGSVKPNSWWFGFAAEHNYQTDGNIPASGPVENFTEQRVLQAIDQTIANPLFTVDTNRIHGIGNSMGASGLLAMAIRYANVFSGVYASQPMTNYILSPTFQGEFRTLWGQNTSELPVVIKGPFAAHLKPYSQGGAQAASVWDWMNHQQQMIARRGEDFAFIAVSHGQSDTTIEWNTQGLPFNQTLQDSAAGYAYETDSSGHSWQALDSVPESMFGLGFAPNYAWRYPLNQSFLAIQSNSTTCFADFRLSQSRPDPSNPIAAITNQDYDPNLTCHNMYVEWKVPFASYSYPFNAPDIIDQPGYYAVSLRPAPSEPDPNFSFSPGLAYNRLEADITPRRTQLFSPLPGQSCNWVATRNSDAQVLANGIATVDTDGLFTARDVPIEDASGILLEIDCISGSATSKICDVDSPALQTTVAPMTWTLLSLPCTLPKDTTVGDIFNDDVSGGYVVYVYDYIDSYVQLGADVTAPVPGQGFWFIHYDQAAVTIDLPLESAHPVTLKDPPCVATDAGCKQITANKQAGQDFGWNLGGNPLPNDIAVDDLRVTGTFTCEAASNCTLSDAASAQTIFNTFYRYSDGAYSPVEAGETISPWQAHWYRVMQNGDDAVIHWPAVPPVP